MKQLLALLDALAKYPARTKYGLIVYTIVGSLLALLLGGVAPAAVIILSGLIGIVALRADDMTELKFLSLQVKMEKSISAANATIEQLRKLAAVIAAPVVGQIALSGQFMKYQTFASKQDNINEIARCLKDIGIDEAAIASTLKAWKIMACHRVFTMLKRRLSEVDEALATTFSQLRSKDALDEDPEKVIASLRTIQLQDPEFLSLKNLYIELWERGTTDQLGLLRSFDRKNED